MLKQSGKIIWQRCKGVMYAVLSAILKIFHRDLSEEGWQAFLQFVKFGLVGISNTIVSYLINIAVLFLLQAGHLFPAVDYYIANVAAFILSVLWSFYWNHKYVFRKGNQEKGYLWRALLKTYLSYAFTGIILSNVLSYVWVELFHISKYIAPLINSIIGVPINFVLNKFWAFQDK